jgi:hypothetical protein
VPYEYVEIPKPFAGESFSFKYIFGLPGFTFEALTSQPRNMELETKIFITAEEIVCSKE